MGTTPLPINERPYYNTDQIANSIAADDMMDCILEPVPDVGFVTRRRPGLKPFTDLATGTPGDGLFFWESANKVIAVSGGKVFEVKQDGTSVQLAGMLPIAGTTAIFADGQKMDGTPWLYIATGNLIYTTDGITCKAPTDPNTPKATHVAWINSRFVANNTNTNQFLFTDTDPATGLIESDYWSATDNPLTCEAKGDKLSALFTAWQEIYLPGTEGWEVWQDDGVTPFAPLQGAFAEMGIEAVYSFQRADNTIFALCVIDGKRSVIKLFGRAPTVVSEPIARILSEMPDVSDAIGDLIGVGGLAFYVITFPSADQTWAYDYKNDTWVRWGYFQQGEHHRFIGQHACFVKTWNKHLIMSRVDGHIYELDRNIFNDAGNAMVAYRRTGWINNGTYNRKICDQFYVKCKAGESDTATLMVRWRAEGNQEWGNWFEINLSPVGNRDFLSKNNRFGMYRSRQYEFRLSDNVDLVLVGVDTEIRTLSS